MAISKKVAERIVSQFKKYQGILQDAKSRDIGESDTVIIIAAMLTEILGYKQFIEITTEFAIKGTYVDLAVKVGNDVRFLIEAKAVGVSLKDNHLKQAIDYGANQGIEWVILTNGITWQIYKIQFGQPIDKTLIYEFDVLKVNPKNPHLVECLWNLSREGFTKSSMANFCQQQQVTSKFSIAAVLVSPPLLKVLRKELRRISPSLKIEEDHLKGLLQNEVLKREVVDSDEAKQAMDFIKKTSKASAKNEEKAKSPQPETKGETAVPVLQAPTEGHVPLTAEHHEIQS